jgi:preprotein translocase subunit SecY
MNFWDKLKIVFTDTSIRRKVIFVLIILAVFRLLSTVPVPGVNTDSLKSFIDNSQFLSILNIFSGSGLSALSIVMMGVSPYITGSIIMQLLTLMSPRLKSLYHEEGQMGRTQFALYSRYITVPLCLIQSYALLTLLNTRGALGVLSLYDKAVAMIVIAAGSMFLVWLGELISEKGIGNGVSVIIFAGIVAAIPGKISQLAFTFDKSHLLTYVGFVAVAIILIVGVVLVTEAERLLPITHSRQARFGSQAINSNSYLPLRINQAGVMPVIFALSILLFPQLIANFWANSSHAVLASIAHAMNWFVQNNWAYAVAYFVLVVLFTYFYTAVTFDPDAVATNLQKNGAFVPGIRPGQSTSEYIGTIVSRTTLIGAVFLGIIAVLPVVMRQATGLSTLAIGGTAILIVVSVILDILKKVEGQISMRQY